MVKIFLVFAVLAGGQWQNLSQKEMASVDECTAAADGFLTEAAGKLSAEDGVVAVQAVCAVGIVSDGK